MVTKIRNDINGWLVVDKPLNMGSTQVVSFLKRLLHPMKIGHGGTLDPLASGVLPIAFGKATRTVPFVMDGLKTYEFCIRFGAKTATDDLEGEILETTGKIPSCDEVIKILPSFVGDIEQMPPAYSALKVDGKRAYDLVRKGIEPELKSRIIHIEKLQFIEQKENGDMLFEVVCGKGTYVRSLGRDIAQKCGSLGHLSYLRRTSCGAFNIKDSFSLEKIEKMCYNNSLLEQLYSIETVLSDILELALNEEQAKALCFGQSLKNHWNLQQNVQYKAMFEGKLVAFVLVDGDFVRPTKVFQQLNEKEN